MNKEYTDAALEAKRAYFRAWNAANKDKKREYQRKYWEKKAAEKMAERGEPDAQDKADS